jgi:predicted CoA-binding protein
MQLGISNQEAADLAVEAGLDVVMNACMLVEHRRWRASAFVE